MSGGKDGQTLFHRILPATGEGGGGAKRKDRPFRLPPAAQKDVNKIWKLFPLSLNRFGLDDVIDLKIIDKLVLKLLNVPKSVTEIWYLTKL